MRTHAPHIRTRTRLAQNALLTSALGGALVLAGLAEPSWAATSAAKYPGQVKCPKGDYQLCIDGGPGGFTIKGRTFSGHANAILLRNVSNVTVSGNTFKNLSGSTGFAGVHVQNSSGIKIRNNTFSGLRNGGKMHGVYMVKTSGSTITGNTFSSISGDPVRIRNASSRNTVSDNTFTKSGTYALFSEWGRLEKGETCGRDNVFKNNEYAPGGYGGKKISLIKWGGLGGGSTGIELDWNRCKKASIVNKGGNKKL
ncbi:right-handed parallel beta-helix repeat-containing protein [Streptomyces sp. NPDC052309]|uniref:right-handed parallel beta-helix repeat-containing protein n=1 Tax=Streptomyces sp. NPDC052309 TaxID=3155421 RepID=UPI00343338C6